jgi:signal transduction histidine kinase
VVLIARLWRYRQRPGAGLFVAALVGQALFCFSYGAALLTFNPLLRELLTAVLLLALPWMSVLFLGFAFGYTGRSHLLQTWWYRLPLVTAVVWTGLVATNPLHQQVWRDFTVVEVGSIAGATFTHEPTLFVVLGLGTLWVGLGTMLLFETVISYGPLFRGEAIAVGLSPLPPGIAITLWLFEVGPEPALNFAAIAFLPHVLLDSYAFVERDMFEFLPGTRRAGERAAIRDLGSPVAIVDTDGRIVALNDAAERLIGLDEETALTQPLGGVLDVEVDLSADDQRLSIRSDGQRREFVVTPAALTDPRGAQVGYTLVFQDVTEAIQREQRLTVMNRILRHNLRNDLNVVHGTLEAGKEHIEDEALAEMFDRAAETAWGLVETGEKVRAVESIADDSRGRVSVDLDEFLTGIVADLDDDSVTLDVPASLTLRTDPDLLEIVVENLVENALDHGTPSDGVIVVTATTDAETVRLTIEDDGPGIPENELETIQRGTETDLVHGSGLGLWIVTWGVRRLGGDVDFETGADGTAVAVSLPRESLTP